MSCENGDKKAECREGKCCGGSACPPPKAGCKSLGQVFEELLFRPFKAAGERGSAFAAPEGSVYADCIDADATGVPDPVALNKERAIRALAREFGFDASAHLLVAVDRKAGRMELAVDRSAFDKAGRVAEDTGSWRDGASAAQDVEEDYGDEPCDDAGGDGITDRDAARYVADSLDARLAADEERLMEHASNAAGLASLALEKLPDLPSEKYAELVHDAVRAAMVGYVDGIDYLRGDAYGEDPDEDGIDPDSI